MLLYLDEGKRVVPERTFGVESSGAVISEMENNVTCFQTNLCMHGMCAFCVRILFLGGACN